MPTNSKDPLFRLIKSLSKAEKRHFKLYANRTMSSQERKFLQLFDALDKLPDYDDEVLVDKLPGINKSNLPHLKRHLFKQLLTSLRLINVQNNIELQVREQLDFAHILYIKGLYMESLRILERIKETAEGHHQDILHLEILEFQKFIEARHITRSRQVNRKMDQLLVDSTNRSEVTLATSELSNLNIQIQGHYIDQGHAKTPEEKKIVETLWQEMQPLPRRIPSVGTFFEKINRFQSHMWYNYIMLNFGAAGENAAEWVGLFRLNPQMKEKDPDLYMRGLYYMLVFQYLLNDYRFYNHYLKEFQDFIHTMEESFSPVSQYISFQYFSLALLNEFFLSRSFERGYEESKKIRETLQKHDGLIDEHRQMLFYYKFAYLSFATGRFDEALDLLNSILDNRSFLREDLHYNAHLLELLCRYQLGQFALLDYRITALQRLLTKGRDVSQTQKRALTLLRQLASKPPAERTQVLEKGLSDLKALQHDPYEYKTLKYLDLLAWIKSQLQQTTVAGLYPKGENPARVKEESLLQAK